MKKIFSIVAFIAVTASIAVAQTTTSEAIPANPNAPEFFPAQWDPKLGIHVT